MPSNGILGDPNTRNEDAAVLLLGAVGDSTARTSSFFIFYELQHLNRLEDAIPV